MKSLTATLLALDTTLALMAPAGARALGQLLGERRIDFDLKRDLAFEKRESLPGHPNGLRFVAMDAEGNELLRRVYYSVGGGFVVNEDHTDDPVIVESSVELPYPFESGNELLEIV